MGSIKIKNNQNGQVLLFVAVLLLGIIVAALTVVNVGMAVHSKVRLQTAADAAARSAAVWKARALNEIATLNSGIIGCFALEAILGNSKPEWRKMLTAQAVSYTLLQDEINSKIPWQATVDAYSVAYLTASGGQTPKVLPQKGSSAFPQEPYGALVFSRDGEYPMIFNLTQWPVQDLIVKNAYTNGLNAAVIGTGMANNPDFFRKVYPMALSSPYEDWQKKSSIKAVAWRRNAQNLFGVVLDKLQIKPGICFGEANVFCEENAGAMALFVPHWRAALVKSAVTRDELECAAQTAGLYFWQGKDALDAELIRH